MSKSTVDLVQQVWQDFSKKHPLLYLPGCTPNTDFGYTDRRRQFFTQAELKTFAVTIEERTNEVIEFQAQTLAYWNNAATMLQRVSKGFLARQYFHRLKIERLQQSQLEIATKKQYVHQMQRENASRCIQRVYRKHIKIRGHQHKCACLIQCISRLYIWKQRRTTAAKIIQQMYYKWQFRQNIRDRLKSLVKWLHKTQQHQKLVELTTKYTLTRKQAELNKKKIVWYRNSRYIIQMAQQKNHQIKSTNSFDKIKRSPIRSSNTQTFNTNSLSGIE